MSENIVQGFSVLNRALLYTSLVLSPAHFISGWSGHGSTNVGFLAYNYYNQIVWYQAVRAGQLHALSLLPVHFNIIYCITYLAGIAAGNLFAGIILALGTGGVMILNCVAAWLAWKSQTEGFGEYKFFFFGWRTLSDGWHKFFLVWQIGDSMIALSCFMLAMSIPFQMYSARQRMADEADKPDSLVKGLQAISNWKYPAIILGSVLMLVIVWPLILWVELIIQHNHIESETDWVSVWLFVGQCGLLVIPSFGGYLLRGGLGACFRRDKGPSPVAGA